MLHWLIIDIKKDDLAELCMNVVWFKEKYFIREVNIRDATATFNNIFYFSVAIIDSPMVETTVPTR